MSKSCHNCSHISRPSCHIVRCLKGYFFVFCPNEVFFDQDPLFDLAETCVGYEEECYGE